MAVTLEEKTRHNSTKVAVIDCDIHNIPPSEQTLTPYLPQRWRRHHEIYGKRNYSGAYYPRANPRAARADSWPPSGAPPGSDLDFMRTQLLDTWDIEYGVLSPLTFGNQTNFEYAAVRAQAMNDWQIAEWTDPEPRLRASMIVPYEDGELAAAEIHRVGDNPGFAQILILAHTLEPLGRRKYWRLYEAAVEHDLAIGIHFGGVGGVPMTGAGWPAFYLEEHAGMPTAFQAQIISLVCEGVFERFPTLKVVLIEGGFGWMASLMWRLDRSWKVLRSEVPHLRRLPSEYIRDHFWMTTQPVEEPPEPEQFLQLLAQIDMNDHLMFATDYPHWDFDAPDRAIPAKLEPELERRIMAENARALYDLPAPVASH